MSIEETLERDIKNLDKLTREISLVTYNMVENRNLSMPWLDALERVQNLKLKTIAAQIEFKKL